MFNTLVASFKDFLLDEVSLSVVTIQNWMLIAMAILVILLIAVILSAVKNSKKNSSAEKEEAKSAEETASESDIAEEKEEVKEEADSEEKEGVKEEAPEEKEETKEEAEVAEPVKDEKSEAIKEEAVVEDKKEEAPVEEKKAKAEPVKEEKIAEEKSEPAKEEKRAVTKTRFAGKSDSVFGADTADKVVFDEKPAKKETKAEKPAKKEVKEIKAEEVPVEKEEAAATEEQSKTVTGKFELCNSSLGGFRYHLLANNGQLLYESRDYKTIETCRDAIAKFVNSVEKGSFSIKADKFGNYKYSLKSATSNNVIYVGESYTTKKSCLSSVESVKRFATVSPVIDATIADFVPTATPFEIPAEAVEAVKNKQGAVGRWAIDHTDVEDPSSPYVFLLYANNGQLLYESRDYKTYDNCRKGVDAFVSAVENGYFIIDDDKFKRYKFFLRSNKTGSQAEYVGQNYDDKSSCESSAISVYKFALLTPVTLD